MRTRTWVLSLILAAIVSTTAHAQCPMPFRLSGSSTDKTWQKTTNTAWKKMLPKGWEDNGFHFYSRVRARGPEAGIDTPSDLESEIMKKGRDEAGDQPNRRQIVLPIKNSKGESLKAVYDYTGRAGAPCQLVTLTY